MNPFRHLLLSAALLAAVTIIPQAGAQAPLITIETVPVGDAGNAPKRTISGSSSGAVAYPYRIGKFEVTLNQYAQFLNAVARTDNRPFITGLWAPQLQADLNIAGIARRGSGTVGDPYIYTVIGDGNRPVTYVSWLDAARFANWVNNGATIGANTETGAYALNGATNRMVARTPGATWYLPTEDEWYKAAYYKGGGTNAGYWRYATRSDTAPGNVVGSAANQANYKRNDLFSVTQSPVQNSEQNYLTPVGAFSASPSAYGTYDQTGNVWEYTDTPTEVPDFPDMSTFTTNAGAKGGSWFDAVSNIAENIALLREPNEKPFEFGFRLVNLTSTPPDPTPTPAITSVKITPAKRTIVAGKTAKIMVMVANNSTQPQTVEVSFTSSNPEALPAPVTQTLTILGKKTMKQKARATRLSVTLAPAVTAAAGSIDLTATVADLTSPKCVVTIRPARIR